MKQEFILKPGHLTLENIEALLHSNIRLVLSQKDYSIIKESRELVDNLAEGTKTIYGINTGFGVLANKKINKSDLADLQKRLVLSHAVGVGRHLDDTTIKLI